MSQEVDNFIIDNFSEKEQNIVFNIKDVDDELCESNSFYEIVDDYILKLRSHLCNYVNTPTYDELEHYSFDVVLGNFMSEIFPDDFFKYLYDRAKVMCEDLGCSFKLYGVPAFSALWFTAKGDFAKAAKFVIVCFQPITSMMRISSAPRNAGRLGGRPVHHLKAEALELARHKWSSMEYASLNIVATAVKHQLDLSYKSTPSLPAIKKWITEANIRPVKSYK